MKIQIGVWFVAILTLNSCATVLNKRYQTVKINTEDSIQIVSVSINDSTILPSNNKYLIDRSTDSITINYLKNKESYQLVLTPFLSNAYWWNIYYNYGLGMLVDELFKRKKAFLKNVYLTNDHQLVKERKGNSKITIGSEYGFIIGSNTLNENYIGASIMPYNLSLGYEYYYEHNTFVSIVGGLIPYLGGFKNPNSEKSNLIVLNSGISVRNNHVLNNFELGYGLNFSNLHSNESSLNENKIGLSFIAANQMAKSFGLALIYEPNYYNLNQFKVELQHNAKFQMRFKIGL